jgi:hypothetical protein
METPGDEGAALAVPRGMSAGEAGLVLDILARLKTKRFGRFTVSDGRVVDIELIEKFDRTRLPGAGGQEAEQIRAHVEKVYRLVGAPGPRVGRPGIGSAARRVCLVARAGARAPLSPKRRRRCVSGGS